MKRSFLPPLHQAIIEGDLTAVKKLQTDHAALTVTDQLGFTALELAGMLNRRSAASIIDPAYRHRIKAIPKGKNSLLDLSESEFKQSYHVTYAAHPVFPSYEELKRVLANCPWVLAKSPFGEENRQLAIEFASQLKAGRCTDISIRWIDEQLGYGVFAEADLPKGTFIGEFTGLVRQLSRKTPTHNPYCFHYPTRFWSWNYYAIDALDVGNETRFINHSDRPNLQPLCLCERRLLHIIFTAKDPIKTGTQLTYDYGRDFWKTREKIDI